MLTVKHLTGGYDENPIIKDVSFSVQKGEFFGVLGPNGSGKTTLLKMLTGVQSFQQGEVFIENKRIQAYSAKERARMIAVLPQVSELSYPYTVKEIVSLGRYAHQRGLLKTLTREDEKKIEHAMKQTDVLRFAHKPIQALSGGEKQRVYLAQALAQEPKLLFLDEPTNHLDLAYQKQLLDMLRKWTEESGLTVVAVFHDLDLASLYCDRLLMLHDGKVEKLAAPAEVLKEEMIEDIYKIKTKRLIHPERSRPLLTILPEKMRAEVEPISFQTVPVVQTDEYIVVTFPFPLKTLSSAVVGSGLKWKQIFVNRRVSKDYDCDDPASDMLEFLEMLNFSKEDSVCMMTAATLSYYSKRYIKQSSFELFVIVTAGVGNAVDVSKATEHVWQKKHIGTINTWVFINGQLTDEAFIQAVMTATEAKAKALFDEQIIDPVTHSIATGTSTDSILISATQRGETFAYAGTITPLGKAIGKAVYECTVEAIRKGRGTNG